MHFYSHLYVCEGEVVNSLLNFGSFFDSVQNTRAFGFVEMLLVPLMRHSNIIA